MPQAQTEPDFKHSPRVGLNGSGIKIPLQYQKLSNSFPELDVWILIPQIDSKIMWTTKRISLADGLYHKAKI